MLTTNDLGLKSDNSKNHTEGATLTEDEMKRRIKKGEIKRDDLTIQQRERFQDILRERKF